ncbi:MAG: hypothetical protein M3R63_19320 [Actinomycetota bacterium]|nr:hypothetical protein [Actinomycetota bacterium]
MRAIPEKVLRRVRGMIGTGGNERFTVAVTRNPKGGTELDRAEDLFRRLVYGNGADVPTPLVLARTGRRDE